MEDLSETERLTSEVPNFGHPIAYDRTFKCPVQDRHCTDIIWAIIFVLTTAAFLAVGVWTFFASNLITFLTVESACNVTTNAWYSYAVYTIKEIGSEGAILIIIVAMANAACIIFTILLRILPIGTTIVLLIGTFASTAFFSYMCIYHYVVLTATYPSYGTKIAWLILGIIGCITEIILIIILAFSIPRIEKAMRLIREAARATHRMLYVLIWPVFPFLVQLGLIAFWVATVLHIVAYHWLVQMVTSSNSSSAVYVDGSYYDCSAVSTSSGNNTWYTVWIEILVTIAFLWMLNFTFAVNESTLCGAFMHYYWAAQNMAEVPNSPILVSFHRVMRYHTGSMALGSFIIPMVRIFRVILANIHKCTTRYPYACSRCMAGCCTCCFWCFDSWLVSITRFAYTWIAAYGLTFCESARGTYQLIMRNISYKKRVQALDSITDWIFFYLKLTVVISIACYSAWQFESYEMSQPVFFILCLVVVIITTFTVAYSFFGIFQMSVDVLYLCYSLSFVFKQPCNSKIKTKLRCFTLEDTERNDGSPERPYYMHRELMDILKKPSPEELDRPEPIHHFRTDPKDTLDNE